MDLQLIKEMLISELLTNDGEPRSWEWRYSHLTDMDNYDEKRFICTPDRFPYSRIMYTESIRAKNFERARDRILKNDIEETKQFRPIIIDEYGMVISGMKVLQLYKSAGHKSVEVAQIIGLSFWEKLERMMADSDNYQQHNWTPFGDEIRHKKVLNFSQN